MPSINPLARPFWYNEPNLRYIKCGDSILRFAQPSAALLTADVDLATVQKRLGTTSFAGVASTTMSADTDGDNTLLGFARFGVKPAGAINVNAIYPMAGTASGLSYIQPHFNKSGDAGADEVIYGELLRSFGYYPRLPLTESARTNEEVYHHGAVYFRGVQSNTGQPIKTSRLDSAALSIDSGLGYGFEDRWGPNGTLNRPATSTVFYASQAWADGNSPSYPSYVQAAVVSLRPTNAENSKITQLRSQLGFVDKGLMAWRGFTNLSCGYEMYAGQVVGIHKAVKTVQLKIGSVTEADWIMLELEPSEVAAICRKVAQGLGAQDAATVNAMATSVDGMAATNRFRLMCFDSIQAKPDIYQARAIQKAFADGAEQSDVDSHVVGTTTLAQLRVAAAAMPGSSTWMWVDDQAVKRPNYVKVSATNGGVAPYYQFSAYDGSALDPALPYTIGQTDLAAIMAAKPIVYPTVESVLSQIKSSTGATTGVASATDAAIIDSSKVGLQPWKDIPGAWMKRCLQPNLQYLANVIRFGLMETSAKFIVT